MSEYGNIAVVGVGRLGGFVADSISNNESTWSLTIIDDDIVRPHNTVNSIYTRKDSGRLKVDVLYDLLSKKDISLTKINKKFEEIDKLDAGLIIDCRDYSNSEKNVDVRLYVSGSGVVIDSKKINCSTKKYNGCLTHEVKKADLIHASSVLSLMIEYTTIVDFIKNKMIYVIQPHRAYEDIEEEIENAINSDLLVYEEYNGLPILNLECHLDRIIELNKNYSINACVGDNVLPSNHSMVKIPIGSIKSVNDLIKYMKPIINHYAIREYDHVVLDKPFFEWNEWYLLLYAATYAA